MKCDEMKTVCYIDAYSTMPVYCAKEVDEAIDELKAEWEKCQDITQQCFKREVEHRKTIDELKAENERLKKKMDDYHLMSDIRRAKIKELKRALWLARADRALTEAEWNRTIENGWKMFRGNYEIAKEYSNSATKWDKVEQLCRKKAKEYK